MELMVVIFSLLVIIGILLLILASMYFSAQACRVTERRAWQRTVRDLIDSESDEQVVVHAHVQQHGGNGEEEEDANLA